MVGLGDLPGGFTFCNAYAISGDGLTIGGVSSTAMGTEAFVWRNGVGMSRLWDILLAGGFDPAASGWSVLQSIDAINFDGTALVGSGLRNGVTEAFLANIAPIPEHRRLSVAPGIRLQRAEA